MSFKNFVSIKTGKLDANAQVEDGKYPFYTCAAIPSRIDTILDDCECVLLVGNGANTGMVFYNNGPFNAYQRTYIIRPLDNLNVKYLYWYLRNYTPFLLESSIGSATNYIKLGDIQNLPDIKHDIIEQGKIVKELDELFSIVEIKKSQLLKLDELVKSRFIEMFEGKGYPKLKWNEVFHTTTGKLDSNAMVEDGQYPFFTCAKEVYRIDKYAFDQEALLLAGNNAAGKYDVKYYKGKFNAYQRTYVLGLKQNWSYQLFRYQLEDKLGYLQQQSLGGLTKYLTIKILGELDFIVPPMEEQNQFATFVEQTDKSKLAVQKSIDKLETLKKSLMQKYFG